MTVRYLAGLPLDASGQMPHAWRVTRRGWRRLSWRGRSARDEANRELVPLAVRPGAAPLAGR